MRQKVAKLPVYTTSKPAITPSLSINPHRNLSILPQNPYSGDKSIHIKQTKEYLA